MNDRYLLEHIKELENYINELHIKEKRLKKISSNLKKLCKSIIDINVINEDKKTHIIKSINSLIINLDSQKEIEHFYNNQILLNKYVFLKLISDMDIDRYILFIMRLKDDEDINFASTFISSKFTPYMYLEYNRIIGVLKKNNLKEFEETTFIPYFKEHIYKELKFFTIIFETKKVDETELYRSINIFDRFYLKPSMNDKTFVHYSLIENKIIDFEKRAKEQIKREFAYLYELNYPEIELLLRKEIKNINFLFALLDRIDTELKEIKQSKGRLIVVKRILLFIFRNQLDKDIQEMVKLIFEELEETEYIKVR